MNEPEDRKEAQQHDFRIAHGDDPRNQMPEHQNHEHHHNDRAQHAADVRNLTSLKDAKQKHRARNQQQLDDDVNRHQNFRPGLKQRSKRGRGLRFRIVDQPADGDLVHRAESDVDDRHDKQHDNEQTCNEKFSSAQHWNLRRKRRSMALISPSSVSWSYPIRCSSPCKRRR